MERDLLVLTLENGEKKEYFKLAEFKSMNTHKSYVMFTDKEELDTNHIYFSIIKNDGQNIIFEKITSEEDINECKKALDDLVERLKKE
ncbi:MAG: DUF1292 domain-containing protein [Bacilli bacterium]|nr:DUF1292 domain-containing protein [Bacilli bacterium]